VEPGEKIIGCTFPYIKLTAYLKAKALAIITGLLKKYNNIVSDMDMEWSLTT
jgi:hypothetical protein